MKFLISPFENYCQGWRIVEKTSEDFPIAEPLFWAEYSEDIHLPDYCYVNGQGFVLASKLPTAATPEQIKAEITASTQSRLDTFANTRNYDGILSACTYASSSIPKFANEGQYCVDARDAT
jgi:hypothetical protein